MRTILITFLISVSVPAFATDVQKVVGYECRNIDAKKYGFSCTIEKGSMHLHWKKDLKQETKEFAQRSEYLFKVMYLRFFGAGGNTLTITGDHWPSDTAMTCSPTPSRQGKICSKCRGKDEDGNYKCDS